MKQLALIVSVECFVVALVLTVAKAHIAPEDFEYAGLAALAASFLLP